MRTKDAQNGLDFHFNVAYSRLFTPIKDMAKTYLYLNEKYDQWCMCRMYAYI